jgi:hypothetical protein
MQPIVLQLQEQRPADEREQQEAEELLAGLEVQEIVDATRILDGPEGAVVLEMLRAEAGERGREQARADVAGDDVERARAEQRVVRGLVQREIDAVLQHADEHDGERRQDERQGPGGQPKNGEQKRDRREELRPAVEIVRSQQFARELAPGVRQRRPSLAWQARRRLRGHAGTSSILRRISCMLEL